MHMADALLSPAVGGAFIAASGLTLAVSARAVSADPDDRRVPLMGVTGAFVFAAQMVNFAIPGTGSSGHLGGGLLLAILLGPAPAFLVMASVLVVQALLFADGGILALGANIWNLGFYPCFVGGMLYRLLVVPAPSRARAAVVTLAAAVLALELGALSVAAQTALSGRSELPFAQFAAVMLGIHLPIGMVEGLVTTIVVGLLTQMRPELLRPPAAGARSLRPVLAALAVVAVITGGGLAWFASDQPDGLEWSISRITGMEELDEDDDGIGRALAETQQAVAVLPDYGFKAGISKEEKPWSGASAGTSLSGIIGSLVVLALAGFAGYLGVQLRGRGPDPETKP